MSGIKMYFFPPKKAQLRSHTSTHLFKSKYFWNNYDSTLFLFALLIGFATQPSK